MIELVNKLKELQLTIGSIESMTGGLFASNITSVPGASKVFKGSVVSYSVLIKENVVGVKKETIDKFGVVSSKVAYEMAEKGRKLLDVDICVSVTGNAGPTAEPGEEGVGVVYLGISSKEGTRTIRKQFNGNREEIRQQTLLAMQEEILYNLN